MTFFAISFFILVYFNFLKDFIYSRETPGEREAETQAEGEAGFLEPDVGPNTGPWGSCPEPKADTQPLSHSGVPTLMF